MRATLLGDWTLLGLGKLQCADEEGVRLLGFLVAICTLMIGVSPCDCPCSGCVVLSAVHNSGIGQQERGTGKII